MAPSEEGRPNGGTTLHNQPYRRPGDGKFRLARESRCAAQVSLAVETQDLCQSVRKTRVGGIAVAVPVSAVQSRASGSADVARSTRSQRSDQVNEHRLGERLETVEGGDRPLREALGLAKR